MPRRAPVVKAKRNNQSHIPGAYEAALRESCHREVTDPVKWLEASGDAATFAEFEHGNAVLADLLFDERFGEPVEAWWYWLPKPLPPMWRGPAAPRRFRVLPGDLVEPLTKGADSNGLSNHIPGKKPTTPPAEPVRRSERRADAPTFGVEHAERERVVSPGPVRRGPEPTSVPTRDRPYVDGIRDPDSTG